MPINFGLPVNCRRLWLIARSHYVTLIKMYEYCVLCYFVLNSALIALTPLFSRNIRNMQHKRLYQRLSLYMSSMRVYELNESIYESDRECMRAYDALLLLLWDNTWSCMADSYGWLVWLIQCNFISAHIGSNIIRTNLYKGCTLNISWLDL